MRRTVSIVLVSVLLSTLVTVSAASAEAKWVDVTVEGEGSDSLTVELENVFNETLEVDLVLYTEGNISGWRVAKGLGGAEASPDSRPNLEPGDSLQYAIKAVEGPENRSLDAFLRITIDRPGAETTTGLRRVLLRRVVVGAPDPESTELELDEGMVARRVASGSTPTPSPVETEAAGNASPVENKSEDKSDGGLPIPAPGPGVAGVVVLPLALLLRRWRSP